MEGEQATTRHRLATFDFQGFFLDGVEGSRLPPRHAFTVQVDGTTYPLLMIGVVGNVGVFEVTAPDGIVPPNSVCQAIADRIAGDYQDHLIIFVDPARTRSYWLARIGQERTPAGLIFVRGQSTRRLHQRLDELFSGTIQRREGVRQEDDGIEEQTSQAAPVSADTPLVAHGPLQEDAPQEVELPPEIVPSLAPDRDGGRWTTPLQEGLFDSGIAQAALPLGNAPADDSSYEEERQHQDVETGTPMRSRTVPSPDTVSTARRTHSLPDTRSRTPGTLWGVLRRLGHMLKGRR